MAALLGRHAGDQAMQAALAGLVSTRWELEQTAVRQHAEALLIVQIEAWNAVIASVAPASPAADNAIAGWINGSGNESRPIPGDDGLGSGDVDAPATRERVRKTASVDAIPLDADVPTSPKRPRLDDEIEDSLQSDRELGDYAQLADDSAMGAHGPVGGFADSTVLDPADRSIDVRLGARGLHIAEAAGR